MKKLVLISALIITTIFSFEANSQNEVPSDVNAIINLKLDDAQKILAEKGYEIASSSMFKKQQLWWNESKQVCISIAFSKGADHKVESVNLGDVEKCKSGAEASRKVWENYHDGQAPVSNAKIDEERNKLASQGFVVSYWINEVSPGRDAEYWVNETTIKAMFIVWEIQGNKWVMTEKTDYSMGQNPSPNKK